ncbi:tetratricopeptide repeat protein, partial [Cyclobacteriaceae bacterium]|nr:tetratricopeptide repeat protein [Cyclobacteriaceae bacterium]
LDNVSLDQIFRNVRSEVLNKTNGNQRPVEASQLTGNAFYLKKSDYSRLESDINILIKKDDYLSALPLSGKLIALDSNNYWAYALQGDIYFYLDLEEKADGLFKKAIKINPKISSLYYRLAESYYYQDCPDLALEEIEKAIKLDPRDESNLHLKSKILGSNRNYNGALVSINKALKLNPSSSILYYRKSKIWDDLGDYNKALKAIDSAIIIDPDIDLFYYNRGLFKSYLYDFEEAIKDFNVSIELDSNDPDYYRLRGQAYDKLGLEDKAREDYNEALAIYDDNALNNLLKGRIFALPIFADFTSAIKYYSRSIKFEETSEAYVGRAEVYSLIGNNEKALSDFDKAIEISPEEPQPYRDRGYFYYEIGENQASINDYNKSLSLTDNSNLSEAMQDKYEIALNLLQLEKTYQAMDELRSIIKNSENMKIDKYFLSQVYTTVGAIYQWIENDFDKSIKNYDMAISLFPTIRDPYIRKAELYANNNQITLAKNVYSTLMKIDSGSVSHQFKGRMNYLLKKFDQAILIFNKVIELDPRETEAYFYLSKIYFDQQKYFDALEMMSNTVKWNRDFKNGYWLTNENFTSCHFGPIERKINSCSPNLIDLLKNRAKIYEQLNANIKACEDYAESCELGDCENYNSYCK